MTQRTYKLAASPYLNQETGRWMREVRRHEDGYPTVTVVAVNGGSAMDVRDALEQEYRHGREDRSEEILGDAGLARAAAAVADHDWIPAVGRADWGGCGCGRLTSSSWEAYNAHLAYEVLQAAARL